MACARSAALTSALLLSLGSAGGCGSSKSAPKPAASATTSAASADSAATSAAGSSATAFGADELKARLLTVADLPGGFTVDSDADANGRISATDPRCQALVDLMNSDGKPPGAVADAHASFTRSELGPNLATGLASFTSAQDAQNLLATVTKAMQGCIKLTETDKDGTSYDFAVAPLKSPTVGDASGAIRMSADIGGYPAQIDIVLARVGSTLLYVANTGLGDTDSELTQDVVGRAVAKVRAPGKTAAPTAPGTPTTPAAPNTSSTPPSPRTPKPSTTA